LTLKNVLLLSGLHAWQGQREPLAFVDPTIAAEKILSLVNKLTIEDPWVSVI
jgi:hypothetical protein